jgi:hypothetical protein
MATIGRWSPDVVRSPFGNYMEACQFWQASLLEPAGSVEPAGLVG